VKLQITHDGRHASVTPEYRLEIVVKDRITGAHIASSHFMAAILTSGRQLFTAQQPYAAENSVQLSLNQTSRYFRFSQLDGDFDFSVGGTHVGLSTVFEYYHEPRGVNLYDTRIGIERKKLKVTLGNLVGGDIDFNLSGRGAKAVYMFNEHAAVEVVGVENTFQLASTIFQPYRASKTIAASYLFDNRLLREGRFSLLHSYDPYLSIRAQMASFESGVAVDPVGALRVSGGVSHERQVTDGIQRMGLAIGGNYQGQIGPWEIYSDNYYSTPSYAGNRRGALILNERLSRELGERNALFVAYSHSSSRPRYFAYQSPWYYGALAYTGNPFFYNRQQLFTVGFRSQRGNLSYSIEPKVENQRRQSQRLNHMWSYRLGLNASANVYAHTLTFTSDLGLSNDRIARNWFGNFKGQLAYHWKGVGLSAMYQFTPYYISDLEQQRHGRRYWAFSIRPSYRFSALHDNLKANVSASTDYLNTFASWMKYVEAHADYAIAPTWELTADLRMTRLTTQRVMTYELNNTQFRLGIRKVFRKRTINGNYRVQLRFYHDENNNRVLDKHERPIENLTVRMDKHSSMTDVDGKVKYLNVPPGSYPLAIASKEAWRLAKGAKVDVKRNVKLDVALIKVKPVEGRLIEKRQQYDRYESDIQGIRVYARNTAGLVESTLTDAEGNFRFYLAPDEYTVYVKNNRYDFTRPSQQIAVRADHSPVQLTFEFRKKETVIKVKRFD